MITVPDSRHWEVAHSIDLKFGECWKECGGYCCSSNHKLQDFALMKCDSAGMVFPLEEYEFLANSGNLQEGFSDMARKFEIPLPSGRSIKFVTSVCELGGICSNPTYRPLICKLYPNLPLIDPQSAQPRRYLVGSVIDQYWQELGEENPCWLHRTKADLVELQIRANLGKLNHPYLWFYFGIAVLFVEMTRDRLIQEHREIIEDKDVFFRHFEILYLTASLLDQKKFNLAADAYYEEIAAACGEFEI